MSSKEKIEGRLPEQYCHMLADPIRTKKKPTKVYARINLALTFI